MGAFLFLPPVVLVHSCPLICNQSSSLTQDLLAALKIHISFASTKQTNLNTERNLDKIPTHYMGLAGWRTRQLNPSFYSSNIFSFLSMSFSPLCLWHWDSLIDGSAQIRVVMNPWPWYTLCCCCLALPRLGVAEMAIMPGMKCGPCSHIWTLDWSCRSRWGATLALIQTSLCLECFFTS